ncbi:hypothetical protein HZ996_11730 [Cryomorphaceae bacterium]|nr:hypothetical protein HZ996_11730 [Cryomorphaceae bacterium]
MTLSRKIGFRLKRLYLIGLALIVSLPATAQLPDSDQRALEQLTVDFKNAIKDKDSTAFNALFFSPSVDFTGIMSEKTEWSIKEGYPEFEGIAVSDHRSFIRDICKADGPQEERFYHVKIDADGAVGTVRFDYSFHSGSKMIQWGHEIWNVAKDQETWLITDVVYSIHFPHVEPFLDGE